MKASFSSEDNLQMLLYCPKQRGREHLVRDTLFLEHTITPQKKKNQTQTDSVLEMNNGLIVVLPADSEHLALVFQAGRKERSDALNSAIDKMTKKTRDLRRQVMTISRW